MNLFISENFIDTVDTKVNVIQLIRHVAEDDDILPVEVMKGLTEVTGYDSIEELTVDIRNGHHFANLAIRDDELYVGGTELSDLFENLYPGDYTSVITSLISSISNATSPSLRLNHNCTPVVPVEVAEASEAPISLGQPYFQQVDTPIPDEAVVTAFDTGRVELRNVQPFPGYQKEQEVLQPEVATLKSDAILGELRVDGRVIPVRQATGKNGVLFSLDSMYNAIYNLQHSPDYLRQVLVEYRTSIDPEDILFSNGTIYLTVYGLAKLHSRLCHIIEWQPLIAKIVNQFTLNPYENASFDLMGNLVG